MCVGGYLFWGYFSYDRMVEKGLHWEAKAGKGVHKTLVSSIRRATGSRVICFPCWAQGKHRACRCRSTSLDPSSIQVHGALGSLLSLFKASWVSD